VSPSDGRTISASATGARQLVGALEALGVEVAFGLPGVHNLAAWKALADSSIRLVGVRHEQGQNEPGLKAHGSSRDDCDHGWQPGGRARRVGETGRHVQNSTREKVRSRGPLT